MKSTPKIVKSAEKKVIGISLSMSMVNNQTPTLWKSFMTRRQELNSTLTNDLISMQVYPADYFTNFNPSKEFTKWACIEVDNTDFVPLGMSVFTIPAGDYAIFHYKGMPGDAAIFQYIYSEWLPKSGYQLDNRPHFEVLGIKYKQGSPDSEEDIWIPIRQNFL